ncbi:MAG: Ig-like domain-containing protein [Bacteroidales bacterium]|nr:Ig-like domain-containing protein [Candidatus Latescibacterota bacterium]
MRYSVLLSLALVILVTLVNPVTLSAQSPPVGYIGLYLDEARTLTEATSPSIFTFYIFCQPGENELFCAEYALEMTSGINITTVTRNPAVSIDLGDLVSGMSVCFLECQSDWIWTHSVQVNSLSSGPGQINITRHPDTGNHQFASCLPGNPIEPTFISSKICVNQSCPDDTSGPVPLTLTTSDGEFFYVYFDEELFIPDAEDHTNFYVYNVDDPDDSIAVIWASPVAPAYSFIQMRLATPTAGNTTYRMEINDLHDIFGNVTPDGTSILFSGVDTIDPDLIGVSALSDSTVLVSFSEPISEASSELPANYVITPGTSGSPLIIGSAERMPEGDSVVLTLGIYIEQNVTYTLTVNNIVDLSGNPIDYQGPETFRAIDITPPFVESVTTTAPYRLVVGFSEPVTTESASDTSNYTIFDTADPSTILAIADITRNSAVEFTVELNDPLQVEYSYSINIVGIEDVSGLLIEPPGITTEFILDDISMPTLLFADAENDTTIRLIFSEPMDPVTASDHTNYSVFETDYALVTVPVISAALLAPGDTIILGLGATLARAISFTVRASGLEDLHDNAIGAPNSADFILPDESPPGLNGTTLESMGVLLVHFDEPVSQSTAENTSNYELFPSDSPGAPVGISSAVRRSDGLEVSLTLIIDLSSGTEYTLRVTGVEDMSGNTIPPGSEVIFTAVDDTPPVLLSVSALDSAHVEMIFSESLDETSSTDPSNYLIYEKHAPSNTIPVTIALLTSPDNRVILTLASNVLSGITYSVEVSDVADLSGNPVPADTKKEFTYIDPEQTSRIGLYADAEHSVYCVDGESTFYEVEMWVWCKPGSSGMICAEFMIDYPANALPATIFRNPNVSIDLGNLQEGISVCLSNCVYNDWVWLYRQTLYVIDLTPSIVAIQPHPHYEDVTFANCMAGYPVETGGVVANLQLNCPETPPKLISADNMDDSHVTVLFNRPVTQETAENISNYLLFESGPPGNVVPLTGSVLQPDSTSVLLSTQVPLTYQTDYTVRVSAVENNYGVPILPASEITFTANETDPPALLSGIMTGQDQLELTFSEQMNESSAENETNYEVFETYDPSRTFIVTTAVLLPDAERVRLYSGEAFLHGISYTVRATDVTDLAGNPIGDDNEIALTGSDTYPPELDHADATAANILELEFNEPLQEGPAENPDNYTFFMSTDPADDIAVVKADLVGTTVTLQLAGDMPPWTAYTLEISGVIDLAGNEIAAGTTAGIVFEVGSMDAAMALSLDAGMADYNITLEPFQIFDIYVWCRPGFNGMMCTEYALTSNPYYGYFECIPIGIEQSSLVSVSLGDVYSGVSTCLSDCQHDWFWITKVQYLYMSGSGYITLGPHPEIGALQFANCQAGYPIEPAGHISAININSDYIATMLQSSSAEYTGEGVEVTWTLQEGSEVPEFKVSRSSSTGGTATGSFEPVTGSEISRNGMAFSLVDRTCVPGDSYIYRVTYNDEGTEHTLFVTEPVSTPSSSLTLRQNRPNPFNPSTTINFYLPEACNVLLEVFDVTGRQIAVLHNGPVDRGERSVEWRGLDSGGNRVSSGIYFYRLTAGRESISKKMVLMR